ncbi:unnamed protein product [Haemonchus placei]|uniref:SCP domain-containing protein n=1 Tax=Haemonchus placei TaxID=6290 RepID=A0A0N4WAP9_HAEPC|nr:unnamed protein product [Haemonchus placei]
MKESTPASGSTSSGTGESEGTSTASGIMSSGMSESSPASGTTSSSMGESEKTSAASGTMSSGKCYTQSCLLSIPPFKTAFPQISKMSESSPASGTTSSSMGESEKTSTASGTMSSGMSEGSPASGSTRSSMGESEKTGMSEFSPTSGSTSSSMGESKGASTISGTISSGMSESTQAFESTSRSTEESKEKSMVSSTMSSEKPICPNNHVMDDMTRNNSIIAHNYRRSRLAQGLVKNKNGKDLPKASNMLRLLYNCDLENSAITSATRCSANPMSSLPSDIQENIYLMPKSDAQDPQDAIIVAIKHWWSQIRITGGIGQGVTYTTYNQGKPTEWFTRMAWATTQYFGCAVISCGDSNWSAVCHYKPGGNILNEHLYEKGTPCSACPSGDTCDSEYLCVPPGTTL